MSKIKQLVQVDSLMAHSSGEEMASVSTCSVTWTLMVQTHTSTMDYGIKLFVNLLKSTSRDFSPKYHVLYPALWVHYSSGYRLKLKLVATVPFAVWIISGLPQAQNAEPDKFSSPKSSAWLLMADIIIIRNGQSRFWHRHDCQIWKWIPIIETIIVDSLPFRVKLVIHIFWLEL